MTDAPSTEAVRIDKWLWAARMFKTRSAASSACTAGHVKIDGESVKASKTVKPGDHIDVLTPGGARKLEVVALGDRRGPASVAQTLYLDHTPPPPPKEERVLEGLRDPGAGRPTKKQLRELRKLRGW
ncbi:MAG: RNA-binding S4 domain-containing protein [Enhygromyxa sp.]